MGRIVYCTEGSGNQDMVIKQLGGAGTIIGDEEIEDGSYTTLIAGAFVDMNTVGKNIEIYINSTK